MACKIITVDGPSGAGKSTICRILARRIQFSYIDTGAMYRAVGWAVREAGLALDNETALTRLLADIRINFQAAGERNLVFCNGSEITDLIRSPEIDRLASEVSRLGSVRRTLLPLQRQAAASSNAIIDGRDAGTIIFPQADLKIFLDADLATRAQRRFADQKSQAGISLDQVTRAIVARDQADSSRKQAPLIRAADAILIDSSAMTEDQVCEQILILARERNLV